MTPDGGGGADGFTSRSRWHRNTLETDGQNLLPLLFFI